MKKIYFLFFILNLFINVYAKEKEYSDAMLNAFIFYHLEEYKKAYPYLLTAASENDSEAMRYLGTMYLWGDGVKTDYKKAMSYFEKSYELGDVSSAYWIGFMFEDGKGVKVDYKKSFLYYSEASRNNDPDAQFRLGLMYYEGKGLKSSPNLASTLFRKAAERGHPQAQYNLAVLYSQGIGISKDYTMAYFWSSVASSNSLVSKDEAIKYAKLRDDLEALITPQQIAKTQESARNFVPKKENSDDDKPLPETKKSEPTATTGTAFLVNKQGHLLTNAHVVNQCKTIKVYSENETALATIVARDEKNDMAIIKTDVWSYAKPMQFSKQGVGLGQDIYAIGYPLPTLLALDLQMTKGNVSALAGLGNDSRFYQISAPVQSGNSGGPLVNGYGLVSGMVTSKANLVKVKQLTGDFPQNVNFAIKESQLKNYLDTNRIAYDIASSSEELKGEEIAAMARKYTVLVECLR